MKPEDNKLRKFDRKSEFESEVDSKVTGFETLTNIEVFQQGRFPENLVEEFKTPENLPNSILFNGIEAKHKEILKERPLPELLENSQLIGSVEDLKPPVMGKLYEEKNNYIISSKDKKTTD
jgi:hypothetical protein